MFFSSVKESNIKKLVSFSPFPELISIKFKHLISFELNSLLYNFDALHLFFEANQSIKYLTFNYLRTNKLDHFKIVLRIISLLSNLIHLSFKTCDYGFNEEEFSEDFTQLALNCEQLKSIECLILYCELASSLLLKIYCHLLDSLSNWEGSNWISSVR